ncbi:helix-turn-helix domain-containing protein [Hymenobacter cellulosivorans]|uniref:Helix-turn-helix domain-containing protein n=1 Tax=Hymenobacter cellulosivorans TaxID=2932249 RepID=A0ABY4FAH7_9BACT|nr:helix-turn-helix domain-containing protein [Hymenobacter cellulosivorans]UOQ51446.1 helix-turn-helix domain-containing protein [Hymenobacter cellulosivorans]
MHKLSYEIQPPAATLAPIVESFWRLQTGAVVDKPVLLLPDGRLDVLFSYSRTEPLHVMLMGLGTEAEQVTLAAETVMCAVSLRLPAAEYLLGTRVADILNSARPLPSDFWGITAADLTDFRQFYAKLNATLPTLLSPATDLRKLRLFEQIYATDGASPVHQLAAEAGWSSRQMNRYFQEYFGLSLKSYCAILRFRASFPQLKAGRLFPEQDFTDQAHFIREVRKFAGVRPKDLARNADDRFIQFSAWPQE